MYLRCVIERISHISKTVTFFVTRLKNKNHFVVIATDTERRQGGLPPRRNKKAQSIRLGFFCTPNYGV